VQRPSHSAGRDDSAHYLRGDIRPRGIRWRWAVEQLWPFWLAPIVGAALAGVIYVALAGEDKPVATTAVAAAA
jgi:glycerol uptake facilitator-like aquaporin